MKIIRDNLEIAQACRCLSSAALARLAGVSEPTLRAAKRGKNCRPDTVGKLAGALGVPVELIVCKEVTP